MAKVTDKYGKTRLVDLTSREVLEQSLVPDYGIAYLPLTDEWVSKEQLETVIKAVIIPKAHLPKIENKADKNFVVDGTIFNDDLNLVFMKKIAYRNLVAIAEIERRLSKKEAEAAEAERVARALAEGKERREIAAIRDELAKQGVQRAQGVAESLYAAGVRKV